jgi:hypothetical protein
VPEPAAAAILVVMGLSAAGVVRGRASRTTPRRRSPRGP